MVQRVDVLTGGASTTYGADAVAGVVNFVLDTEFEGIRGGIQWNGFQHNNNNPIAQQMNADRGFTAPQGSSWDAGGVSANLAVGGQFADRKGHASAYIDFRNIKSITKDARDYTNCSNNLGDDGPTCSGSTTTPQGRFISFNADFSQVQDLVVPLDGRNEFDPRRGEVFNFGPFNFMQRPDRKYSGGGFARYTVNEHFEPYAEIMFMDNNSDAQIAPTGNFARTSTLNCDNPMLSEQQFDLICTQMGFGPTDNAEVLTLRRNLEGGNRTALIRHTSWRLLGGFRGDINEAWSYDVYGIHSEVSSPQSYINDFHENRIADALDVVGNRDDPSSWRCRSGNAGCVPWNIFENSGTGAVVGNVADGVTQAAIDYLSVNAVLASGTTMQMVNGALTADLESYGLMFPSASEGVQVAFGAQYRTESLNVNPDEVYELGLRAGSGGGTVAVDGGFNVTELFAEALVPLVQDTGGAQDLSLELGYRYADYSLAGGTSSYKAGLSWAPNSSVRVRAGFNRAVRAPNARELFRPQGLGLGGSEDICATATPQASQAECANTGVSAAQYGNILPNPANQYNTLSGGNPELAVESADTYTVGLVWTPESITGLSATIDYYDIKVEDTIDNLNANDIVQTCARTGDALLCNLIHRDNAGTLWLTDAAFTETTEQNIGQLAARGVDASVRYPWNLGDHGFINLSLTGSAMLENRLTNPLISYDCAGFYGNQCGVPNAKWRHRVRATWHSNFNTSITLGWRYIHSVLIDDASDNPDLGNPALIQDWMTNDSFENPAFNWLDFAATYTFRDGVRLTAGVNNVLDKEPPLGAGVDNVDFGPGDFGTYDPLGRTVYTGLQFEF